MPEDRPFRRLDAGVIEERQSAERSPLRIRWWLVLPLAAVMAGAQAALNLSFEFGYTTVVLISTQISIIAFIFLAVVTLALNPLLRATKIMEPFNRGELMALFASLFVSAGISTFGLVDQLIPLIAAPFDPSFNLPQRGWDAHVIPFLRRDLFITDTAAITQYREGFAPGASLWTRIPWMLWVKPIALWMIFVAAVYLLFYGLSMVLYDSWARREKLVFPLARLPEDLMHDDGAPAGTISSTLKSPFFWSGFIFVFLLLSYNGALMAEWLPGMTRFAMGISEWKFRELLADSVFRGISDGGPHQLMALVIFTAVGIGYLLPLEISASLWIYYLVGIGMLMVAIWTAVGSSTLSFPSDWLWENHFVSALGAGGLLAYSTAALAKVVAERWAQVRAARGRLPPVAAAAATLASFGWGGLLFAGSCAAALGWLAWCRVPLHWGMAFLAVVILITVGLMRVVAEGGVYWFQIHTGPFHLAKLAGAGKVIPAAALAPLMPIYSVLFLDIKTYMAPAVINSFKMQEESRASRRWYHAIVAASIAVTVIVSVVTMLYYVYRVGANHANGWFFAAGPAYLFDQADRLVTNAVGFSGTHNWIFYLIGGGWVVLSLLLRRRFFWWLHPIGLVMMCNPLMTEMWFSFFIGWLCKKITTKYGGRHMFARLRPMFIGLIFGELMACFFWSALAAALHLDKVRMDLNR